MLPTIKNVETEDLASTINTLTPLLAQDGVDEEQRQRFKRLHAASRAELGRRNDPLTSTTLVGLLDT
eukprot:6478111-Amphidinium_carterae.1